MSVAGNIKQLHLFFLIDAVIMQTVMIGIFKGNDTQIIGLHWKPYLTHPFFFVTEDRDNGFFLNLCNNPTYLFILNGK